MLNRAYNEIKISTKDSSGNDSNVTLEITVSDDEAPKPIGATNKTLYVGDTYNPLLPAQSV